MSHGAAPFAAALLLLGCAEGVSWSPRLAEAASEVPSVTDASSTPSPATQSWLEGSGAPCQVRPVDDPLRVYQPAWEDCDGVERCRRLRVDTLGGARLGPAAYHDGVGYFLHQVERRTEILYTVARTDGGPSYTLSVPCLRVHCALTNWTMDHGQAVFFGPTYDQPRTMFWTPLDRLHSVAITPAPDPYLVVHLDATKVGVFDRGGVTYVDRAGRRWTEAVAAGPPGAALRRRRPIDDAWIAWTDHEIWVLHPLERPRLVRSTDALVTNVVTDGRHVAWDERADRYAEVCDHWLLPRAADADAAEPRAVHSGDCDLLVASDGLLLVRDEDAHRVMDVETGRWRSITAPLRRYSQVLYLAREEMLLLSGGLYRIELE